jgi:hypothetical protein
LRPRAGSTYRRHGWFENLPDCSGGDGVTQGRRQPGGAQAASADRLASGGGWRVENTATQVRSLAGTPDLGRWTAAGPGPGRQERTTAAGPGPLDGTRQGRRTHSHWDAGRLTVGTLGFCGLAFLAAGGRWPAGGVAVACGWGARHAGG